MLANDQNIKKMSSDYAKPYSDFIGAFEKLFHIKSNESVECMCDIITNVLISKYQLTKSQLTEIILKALQYNYTSGENYIKILKNIGFDNKKLSNLTFPLEGSVEFIVMHDQIDKFKEYISQAEPKNDNFLKIPDLNEYGHFNLSLIEACAYFGSVNIFFFLISNQKYAPSTKCLQYSLIGRNTDIINECLKDNKMDKDCLRDIVCSHNNEMLEFVLERNIFTYKDFDGRNSLSTAIYEDIIKYQNLKAVFLLFKREKNFMVPWCAAFPQTIDILKNEKLPDKIDFKKRNILQYACMSQNSDIFKFLFNSTDKIDVNYHDIYKMTALHYAAMYNNIDALRILISHGADINAKLTQFHFILIIIK
ncbi:hypothetical protein TVAG_054200 [Trichomonas vaginalis G3]|uniref:DUF3447 domain-containing protein n=1 Tax=Trichomonas vaginalis (strain ATCC PRA-98 / G3) TaxID=412133 RepID=A2FMQ8_TRIV3|nr:proteasome regulatory particle assembly [Trichomonas vaginalis G3]EAX93815.1 hypothetical protein TVAG_054200 [Trichomonas vaginalis G3]KAI5486346.1 proteasome regulatory particle assembly [Trichomonas vaginalis G3]|eukprot:XP_001306745.1 hypothetical protein [Trichomonas vaginalis G3]